MLSFLYWELSGFPFPPDGVKIENGSAWLIRDFKEYGPVAIPEECLRAIEKSLESVNFWKWEKDYCNPDILDGTQWELRVRAGQTGNRRKNCSGSNEFPRGWDVIYRDMRKLKRAIAKELNLEDSYD